jgi:chemotaxis signal transduction protein
MTQSVELQVRKASERFILTQLERLTLVFPGTLVAETLLVDRSQILPLPFYPPVVLGCIHHAGQLVPLVATDRLLGIAPGLMREQLAVVRLGNLAKQFAGVGLIVERFTGSKTSEQLPSALFNSEIYFPAIETRP